MKKKQSLDFKHRKSKRFIGVSRTHSPLKYFPPPSWVLQSSQVLPPSKVLQSSQVLPSSQVLHYKYSPLSSIPPSQVLLPLSSTPHPLKYSSPSQEPPLKCPPLNHSYDITQSPVLHLSSPSTTFIIIYKGFISHTR